jgi:hypothetical protein
MTCEDRLAYPLAAPQRPDLLSGHRLNGGQTEFIELAHRALRK